jgi:UDP-N-acetylmuramyl tripeptide synthase
MSVPYLVDSRRLTGRSILLDAPGAVLETTPPAELASTLAARWRQSARWLARELGWGEVECHSKWFAPTLHLALAAPIDQLLVATYVAEWAWELALAGVTEHEVPRRSRILGRLERRRDAAANPALVAFHAHALAERAQVLIGDGDLSVGEGDAAQAFPYDAIPDPECIEWPATRHRIPVALVTGTNGKTTTTRLLARMAVLAGHATGFCCTDSVEVAGEVLDRDDYSGPGGTRKVLRHPRTRFAVLEVARGGLLRRGLSVRTADVALVTNIAADHLHDMGVHTLAQMAEVKFLVARALKPNGVLVTNAENEWCRREARRAHRPTCWFAIDPPAGAILRGTEKLRGLATVRDGLLVLERGRQRIELVGVDELGMPGGGRVRHNLANALAAAAAASFLKLPVAAIRRGLREFGRALDDNPGRINVYRLAMGATVIADFGHNAESLRAVFETARQWPRRRLLISLGQAGDRDDEAMRELGRLCAAEDPQRLILKDMAKYRRGREPGYIPARMREGAEAAGMDPAAITEVDGDGAALAAALAWLQAGDLAVLFVHSEIEAVLGELRQLAL